MMQPSKETSEQKLARLKAEFQQRLEEDAELDNQLAIQEIEEKLAKLNENIALKRQKLAASTAAPTPAIQPAPTPHVTSSHRDPDDDWGEGPDPGRVISSPTSSMKELSIEKIAEYFHVANDHVIDMRQLNEQGGSYQDHLLSIQPLLQQHMETILEEMKNYYISITYVTNMIRMGKV